MVRPQSLWFSSSEPLFSLFLERLSARVGRSQMDPLEAIRNLKEQTVFLNHAMNQPFQNPQTDLMHESLLLMDKTKSWVILWLFLHWLSAVGEISTCKRKAELNFTVTRISPFPLWVVSITFSSQLDFFLPIHLMFLFVKQWQWLPLKWGIKLKILLFYKWKGRFGMWCLFQP